MSTIQKGHLLTTADVFVCRRSEHSIYTNKVSGLDAIVGAANDILAGQIVAFACCTRAGESTLPPVVQEVVEIGMGEGGDTSEGLASVEPRFVGKNGLPNGAESHALIPCWYPHEVDSESHIAVALALHMTRVSHWFFRLPNRVNPQMPK